MNYFGRSPAFKFITVFLILIFFQSDLYVFAEDLLYQDEIDSSVLLFNEGFYADLIVKSEKLLSEIGEEHVVIRGKLFLLLGAAYEMSGKKDKAIENYLLGDLLLDKPEVEGIDLNSLGVFSNTIYGKVINGRRVYEKVGKRKRKKKFPYLAIAGAVAIVAAVLIMFKKKTKEEPDDLSGDLAAEVLGEIEWIDVPSGEFQMGDNLGTGDQDERPVHSVYLDSYKISKYEITYSQFSRFSRVNYNLRASFSGKGEEYPVTGISQVEASHFCTWLAEKNQQSISLPTEAQWEKAARGTDQRTYPWGDQSPECGWTNYNNCSGNTSIIGAFPGDISYYGVMDMGGNVKEWVRDRYLEDYYSISPYSNPTNADFNDSDEGILRGGSYSESECRSTDRYSVYPSYGRDNYGFRIVMLN